MGWSVFIQIVRDRPLDPGERKRLAAHARRFKLSRKSETYGFRVAPTDAAGGVIAEALGKFGRDADPEEDADTARLYAALTELRTLFADASLEVGDDLNLVGWDGEQYGVVDDPDQEMTRAPRDRSAWLTVPAPSAPRTRKAPAKRPTVRGPLGAALAAMSEGRPIEGSEAELRELALLAFAALERAAKADDSVRRNELEALLAALPARLVVDAGLDARWLAGGVVNTPIAAALERLDTLEPVRDRLLDVWFGGIPGKSGGGLWNVMGGRVMEVAIRDGHVVEVLGNALGHATFDYKRARLHTENMSLLARTDRGLRYVISRARTDRIAPKEPGFRGPMFDAIVRTERREVLPTILLELARQDVDRDELLVALGRFDDPRVLPFLERALATDQYTRRVTKALLCVPGARSDELLEGLTAHIDPYVRICAAQGLVARRGTTAIPELLAAIGHARAAGIWRDHSPGGWGPFRDLDEARERTFELWKMPWPDEMKTATIPEVAIAASAVASSPTRMLSLNPDVRRDAIELAHQEALEARDASRIRALVAAERWHRALCAHADLPMTDTRGGCSRVNVMNYWSSWRKLARLPVDPMYHHVEYVWKWLDAHAGEVAPQIVPDELAAIAAEGAAPPATLELRLRFEADELAAYDEAERLFVESGRG